MTVVASWVGNGRQFVGDSGTETVTVVKYAGSGGTPSTSVAVGVNGTDGTTVPVNKTGIALFIAVPTALDFTTTEAGQIISVWGKFLDESILLTLANSGMGICLSSGAPTTSNYSLFSFFGSDKQPVGWEKMFLDPTKARTAGVGTLTTSNITHIGVFANVGGTTARFDNLLLSACDVGTGLKVTGTSTLGLINELLTDESTNVYGVVRAINKPESAVELASRLTLGDDSGVLATTITDENSKIFAAENLYYNSGIVAANPLDYMGVELVGNGTGATSVIIGQAVGSDSGRSGWSLIGNETYDVGFDFDDGNVNTVEIYGSVLEGLSGILSWGTNATHKFFGSTLSGCNVFDPVGAVQIRNVSFIALYDDGTADASKNSSLLWNASIDIAACNFLANTHPTSDIAHGIEYPDAGTFSHVGLNFSGNEVDVHFSAATGDLVINKDGNSNASTSTNDSTGTVTIQGSTTFKVTASNKAGTLLSGVAVRYEELDGTLIGVGTTDVSGAYSFSDTVGNRTINIIIRKKGYKFQEFNFAVIGDFNIPRTLNADTSGNRI